MAKLVSPEKEEIETQKVVEEDVPASPPHFGSRYRRIMVFQVDGESNTVPIHLEGYPWVYRPRGVEVVIPEIYVTGLNDSRSPSFKMVTGPPDETGNTFRTYPFTIVRYPFQDLGPATRAEFEADEAKYNRR